MSNALQALTKAQVMVNANSSFMSDGLATAGVTMADLNRGFTPESLGDEGRCDDAGTNYVGDQFAREGFAGSNSKYKRL